MNRRQFLLSLFVAPIAAAAAPFVCPRPRWHEVTFALDDTMTPELFTDRYLAPAARALADQIDADLVKRYMAALEDHVLASPVRVNRPYDRA